MTTPEVIDVESKELTGGTEPDERATPTVAALAVIEPTTSLIRSAAPVAEVQEAFADYQTLCTMLLDDSDYQAIRDKKFRKKSAWRKLAVAFGVSCQIVDRVYDRDSRGFITRAEVVVRATAPNGRSMDGLGLCDLAEKCCDSSSCFKARYADHTCCNQKGDAHDLLGHWSHAQHDVPATASTRATNRACADLFGMGEVSAEEVIDGGGGYGGGDDGYGDQYDPPRTGTTARTAARPPAAPPEPQVDWEGLGYMDAPSCATALRTYTERAKNLTSDERDALKKFRADNDIAWPPPVDGLAKLNQRLDELEGPM